MNQGITSSYQEKQRLDFTLSQQRIAVISKPGLPDWIEILPATRLLAEIPSTQLAGNVLLFGCHQGALAVHLTRRLDQISLFCTDNSFLALELTQATLDANDISGVKILMDVDFPQEMISIVHAVIMQPPKGRKLSRRWLLQSYRVLGEGGSLFLAGANRSGIQSIIKDATELFGNSTLVAYKKGNRLASFIKSLPNRALPTWAAEPGIASGTWVEFELHLTGHLYQIKSLPGVFSFDRLDPGTAMLLDTVKNTEGARVLDVGCGYGIIGMAAAMNGSPSVEMVDSDLLAVASCQETLKANQISHATVRAGDLLDGLQDKKFDLILSNPPFHAGQAVDYQISEALIRQSYQHLDQGGQLVIVANRFIPYDRSIKEVFGSCSVLAASNKYQVLSGVKST